MAAAAASQDKEVLVSELAFTVPLLMESPKCYWIWNYRRWILAQTIQRLPTAAARRIWEAELALVSKMLSRDRRNFHAWGYRRYVVEKLEDPVLRGSSMAEAEFAYTTRMIANDLSNFSAWHARAQLSPRLLRERGASDDDRAAFLDAELQHISEAVNVGPDDQSLWYYHGLVMSHVANAAVHGDDSIAPALTSNQRATRVKTEIENIKDLLSDYPDTKWIYEALLEYTIALARLEDPADRAATEQELRAWLDKVKALDPLRSGRWGDDEEKLRLP